MKRLLLWIVIAVALVFFFNFVQQWRTPMGLSHDMMQIILNWVPMMVLIVAWITFLFLSRSGKWTYVPPGQKEQTEAVKAVAKALERIATALESRRL